MARAAPSCPGRSLNDTVGRASVARFVQHSLLLMRSDALTLRAGGTVGICRNDREALGRYVHETATNRCGHVLVEFLQQLIGTMIARVTATVRDPCQRYRWVSGTDSYEGIWCAIEAGERQQHRHRSSATRSQSDRIIEADSWQIAPYGGGVIDLLGASQPRHGKSAYPSIGTRTHDAVPVRVQTPRILLLERCRTVRVRIWPWWSGNAGSNELLGDSVLHFRYVHTARLGGVRLPTPSCLTWLQAAGSKSLIRRDPVSLAAFDAELVALEVSEYDPSSTIRYATIIDQGGAYGEQAVDFFVPGPGAWHEVEVQAVLDGLVFWDGDEEQFRQQRVGRFERDLGVARFIQVTDRPAGDFAPESRERVSLATVDRYVLYSHCQFVGHGGTLQQARQE